MMFYDVTIDEVMNSLHEYDTDRDYSYGLENMLSAITSNDIKLEPFLYVFNHFKNIGLISKDKHVYWIVYGDDYQYVLNKIFLDDREAYKYAQNPPGIILDNILYQKFAVRSSKK